MNASGKTTSFAPAVAASAMSAHAFSTVASWFMKTGLAWTAATRNDPGTSGTRAPLGNVVRANLLLHDEHRHVAVAQPLAEGRQVVVRQLVEHGARRAHLLLQHRRHLALLIVRCPVPARHLLAEIDQLLGQLVWPPHVVLASPGDPDLKQLLLHRD